MENHFTYVKFKDKMGLFLEALGKNATPDDMEML